jgi:beta-glucosidase
MRPVNEDPRVDLVASASEDTYLTRGKAPSPWRLSLDSAVTARALDFTAQEDARQFSWTDRGSIAIDGPAVDLMRQLDQGFVLHLGWRIDTLPSGPLLISFGGASLDLAAQLKGSAAGTKLETRIPLRCFKEAGADLRAVGTPLRVTASKGFVATLRDVRIEPVGTTISCPSKAQ